MRKKLEPRLIDVGYLNRELGRLFDSVHHGCADPLFIKYKSRFHKEQDEKDRPDFVETKNNTLSVAKKLEILCVYGGHRIVKVDRKA